MTAAPVRKSIHVKVPQARAFEVFTANFGRWWPRSHHIAKVEMKEAVIEPHIGGRWYEKSVDGSECEWGEVLVWEPPSRVVLSWRLNSKFEIDANVDSEVVVRFIADGPSATQVELEHRIASSDAEAIRASVDSPQGWGGLLTLYCEEAQK
ncbi:MAG: SRPBCC family protein [Alphaproteobacteria bacterium]|nr:SRPBCC family protein [Alphaproteobacteria bacterium]MDE2111078.1 SRPBCC family protein [Alphaproteobacteria bacterium]MDE2494778.1 SRPBCC family protein [Alphaproteobacteria bacterium]